LLGAADGRIDRVTADDEHGDLRAAWAAVHDVMDRLPQRVQFGDTHYVDIMDMADRVRGLGIHLDSAVELATQARYEPALVLLRTGLEQCVFDWLLFLGQTLVRRFTGVDESTWFQWQADRAAGAEWTKTVRDWSRTKKGDVRIVREGMYSEPDEHGDRLQISIYYFLLEKYRPTLGPPSAARVDDWAITEDELRQWASENDAIWRVYLKWSSLLANLKENGLVDDVDAGRLAAHYRFLSGFAHPVVDQRKSAYGRLDGLGWPRYDHYTSELVLLYAITLGTLEVRNFITGLKRRPGLTLTGMNRIDELLGQAEKTTSYFWFLGTTPHTYDLWKAHNEACFRAMRDDGPNAPPPAQPPPEDVPYPSDPLRRLIAMHGSPREWMTGLVYVSPWPRDDAPYR
jgi:hypothetical protein